METKPEDQEADANGLYVIQNMLGLWMVCQEHTGRILAEFRERAHADLFRKALLEAR